MLGCTPRSHATEHSEVGNPLLGEQVAGDFACGHKSIRQIGQMQVIFLVTAATRNIGALTRIVGGNDGISVWGVEERDFPVIIEVAAVAWSILSAPASCAKYPYDGAEIGGFFERVWKDKCARWDGLAIYVFSHVQQTSHRQSGRYKDVSEARTIIEVFPDLT